MNKYILLVSVFIFSPLSFGAGPGGEVVSLNCSHAIASALKYIEEHNLKINVTRKNGEFVCVTPSEIEIYIRLQSPDLEVSDKKHIFIINPQTYEVKRYSFSR